MRQHHESTWLTVFEHPDACMALFWDGSRLGVRSARRSHLSRMLFWGGAALQRCDASPMEAALAAEVTAPSYFRALSRADKRDLYREAVFSCKTPFWMALSKLETVSR